jgi:hypothetical protein
MTRLRGFVALIHCQLAAVRGGRLRVDTSERTATDDPNLRQACAVRLMRGQIEAERVRLRLSTLDTNSRASDNCRRIGLSSVSKLVSSEADLPLETCNEAFVLLSGFLHSHVIVASLQVQSFSLLIGGIRARITRVVHLIPLGVDVDVQLFQDRVTQLERIVV